MQLAIPMQVAVPMQVAMPKQAKKCTAIILAGGRSSRMGQDKALLTALGETQLQRTVTLATAAGCDEILISRNEHGFIADRYPAAGPLAGIQSALLHASADRCLVLAVDTPLLTPELVRLLLAYPCSCFTGSPLPAVIPNNQAVCLWLSQRLQSELASDQPHNCRSLSNKNQNQRQHSNRKTSIMAFLRQFAVVEFDCPTPAALLNSNTPVQWQQALFMLQTTRQTIQAPATKNKPCASLCGVF